MTWSYDNTLSTNVDKVRAMAGLTNTQNQLVQNELIEYFIEEETDLRLAAARAIDAAIAQLMRQPDNRSAGGMSASTSSRIGNMRDLAKSLRAEARGQGSVGDVSPFAGGASDSDKDAFKADPDRVQSKFQRGQFDYT